jgi:hypothetical protein
MYKYKVYNDNNSFNIEFPATATLDTVKGAMNIPTTLRVRLVEKYDTLSGLVKEYRQDKTGFTFSIREVY